MAKSKCTLCYGKGFASVIESIQGFDDFGTEGFKTPPRVYKRFCSCRKGKRLKQEAVDAGKVQIFINLFAE